ncbi:uncharacterized protein LOC111389150 [Olea europaea var. sylvestris]|uniref:uncharacterized protein LOC111389150 n=1 Tax=Olea europaea var. sylvestris TaxID=158386 RepID=UPI000C1D4BBA|nr:uncharacterized protein LOC111389150 [Olea europaea var. sylvestris]
MIGPINHLSIGDFSFARSLTVAGHLPSPSRSTDRTSNCEECGKSGHTRDKCFEILGYPDWWPSKNKPPPRSSPRVARSSFPAVHQVAVDQTSTTSATHGLSIEQYNQLMELLKPPAMAFTGDFSLSPNLNLSNVLSVPDFKLSLLSDLTTKMLIGVGDELNRLYYFRHAPATTLQASSPVSFDTWHQSLGHPSLHNVPNLFLVLPILIIVIYVLMENIHVDEYSLVIWLYLMHFKSETFTCLRSFFSMGECVLTATYLINRTLSSSLQNISLFEHLYHTPPRYDHLRVFGCLCYAHTNSAHRDKFQSRAHPYVFLGYPSSYSAYHVYDLEDKKLLTSWDVTFLEHVFPFQLHSPSSPSSLVLPLPFPDPFPHPAPPFPPSSPPPPIFKPSILPICPRHTIQHFSHLADYICPTLPSSSSVTPFIALIAASDGSIEHHKARLVAKDYTQVEGLDNRDTFAPVTKLVTVYCVLAIAVARN